MSAFAAVLATLASHWRRRPWQLAALVAGLAVATALWSGVQALNGQARASYDRAAQVLGGDRLARLEAAGGGMIAIADYVALRRAGWAVSPVLEGRILRDGRSYRVLGIDLLTLPQGVVGTAAITAGDAENRFLVPPYAIAAAPETLAALAGSDLGDGIADEGLPPGLILTDIARAAVMLDRPDGITRLVVADVQRPGLPDIAAITTAPLELRPPEAEPELARLTDSFHLNLTAFGLLSFVVGLFIVHATVGLAFEQRRAMVRTLRACGASQRLVTGAILLELSVLALLSGALGMVLGYALAAALLPDVAASLRGLYGADVPGQLALGLRWWALGLAMTLGGTAAASAAAVWRTRAMPVLAPAQAEAWYIAQRRGLRVQALAAGALALAGLGFLVLGGGLVAGFALMACVLIGAALILPAILATVIARLARRRQGPVAGWFLAESRAQIGGLSLALMALLLALAVNIGVGTMVQSFRQTFLSWLDERLSADIYIRGRDGAEAEAMALFLRNHPGVAAVLPIWSADSRAEDLPVEVYGFRDHPMYRDGWSLIDALPDAWDRVAAGEAALISEQMARRTDLAPGDALALDSPAGPVPVTVAGVYADYGNPLAQARISVDTLTARWPEVERLRFAVLIPGDRAAVMADLQARFGLDPEQAVDQGALKQFSRGVFERTFTVTLALNVLTFAVAGLALLTSLLTLSQMRLPQLAPIWALGLTRARLGLLELLRAVLLAALTAACAIPLGLAVAWILLAVVNVEAFGWRIPMRLYPGQWAALAALALVTAALAAALPALRLRRTPPALLLRIFSDER